MYRLAGPLAKLPVIMRRMPIYIDDQAVDVQAGNLGAALEAVSDRLAPDGRVIVEVILNGTPLVGDELMDHADDAIGGAELKLYSANPLQLSVEVLQQAQTRLNDAAAAQAQAAALLQGDQPNQAMQKLNEALSIWQQAQQAVLQIAQLMGLNLEQQTFEDQPLSATTDALLTQLQDLRDKLQSGDVLGLADALLYEWPQTVERWQRLIGQVIVWVSAAKP